MNLLFRATARGSSVGPYLLFDLFRVAQHVAAAPYCLDVVFALHGSRELFAELADEHVDDL